MSPLLTVVIPTVNRPSELRATLLSVAYNYPIDPSVAVFRVFDNGSTPSVFVSDDILLAFRGNLSIVRSEETISFKDSFAFCVSLACSRYVQVFGDDDIAFGHLGFVICDALSAHQPPSLLYLNRLIGNHDLSVTDEIAHPALCSSHIVRYDAPRFIEAFTHWPSFISSLVFSVDAWAAGSALSAPVRDRYVGYEFLDVLYRGSFPGDVFMIGTPLLIQRRGIHLWKPFWPLFWLQSMRRILGDLDADLLTKAALDSWIRSELKPLNLLADLLICSSNPTIYTNEFWDELSMCFSRYLHLRPFLLIRHFPPFLSRAILRASPNSYKY